VVGVEGGIRFLRRGRGKSFAKSWSKFRGLCAESLFTNCKSQKDRAPIL
jgi:hypothetical protein